MLKISQILLCLLSPLLLQAQFASKGKIVFERKTNVKMQVQTGEDEWMKNLLPGMPQNISSFFNCYFEDGKTVYRFDKNEDVKMAAFLFRGAAKENNVLIDYHKGSYAAQKDVFETSFLIQDSLRKLQWKIEDEVRTIAGYNCRKAVTRICDSVVVVAFYTDQILVSGGPENFNGLPGMILGLAVPRLFTTWFATEVTLIPPPEDAFNPLKKGKKVTRQQFEKELEKGIGDWGKHASTIFWWTNL
jgi:GLPGLI family protein